MAPRRPIVIVFQDALLCGMRLEVFLKAANCEVRELYPNANLSDALRHPCEQPDLVVLPICDRDSVDAIRDLVSDPILQGVPILGVTAASYADVDFLDLRELGVVGLIDQRVSSDHLVFRVNQVVRGLTEKRRFERLRVLLPMDLEAKGRTSREYALSLSTGGIGLASGRFLEPNTDVCLSFSPAGLEELDGIKGRVVHTFEVPDSVPRHRLGIVFYPLADRTRLLLEAALERVRQDSKQGEGGGS